MTVVEPNVSWDCYYHHHNCVEYVSSLILALASKTVSLVNVTEIYAFLVCVVVCLLFSSPESKTKALLLIVLCGWFVVFMT